MLKEVLWVIRILLLFYFLNFFKIILIGLEFFIMLFVILVKLIVVVESGCLGLIKVLNLLIILLFFIFMLVSLIIVL